MDTKQKTIGALKSAAEKVFLKLWELKEHEKAQKAFTANPDSPAGATNLPAPKNNIHLKEIHGRRSDTVDMPEDVMIVLGILRSCIRGIEPDRGTIERFESIINHADKLVFLQRGRKEKFLYPRKFNMSHADYSKRFAEYVIFYLDGLTSAEYGFIGVCPGCDGIFFKHRKDQKHCTSKCKLDSWNAHQKAERESKKQ